MASLRIHSVFEHPIAAPRIEELRAAIVGDLCFLRSKYSNCDLSKIHGTDLIDGDFERMRLRYEALLNYGGFSDRRSILRELVWKWTEATGKYTGCQFWSLKAKELFDAEVEEEGGWPITPRVASCLGDDLSKRSRQKHLKLTHEHVYPIADMIKWLGTKRALTPEEVRKHLDCHGVGCVVLEAEHREIKGRGTDGNPWHRYRTAGIFLAENPAWPESQRVLINAAGLIQHR